MNNKIKGKIGEERAAKYLEQKGFEIVEQNYRYGRGEIDIIGLKNNNLLVFVEVKMRSGDTFGNPEDFVSNAQQELIMVAAENYIHAINWQGDIRFDIMAIDGSNNEMKHIEDAFG